MKIREKYTWRRRFAAPEPEPREPEYAGIVCSVCKNELFRGEEYGTDGARVVCGDCAREELMGLSDGELMELMGLEVKRG